MCLPSYFISELTAVFGDSSLLIVEWQIVELAVFGLNDIKLCKCLMFVAVEAMQVLDVHCSVGCASAC